MASAWGSSWGRAWGNSWGSIAVASTSEQGMGPGWNLFHPPSIRKRKPEDLERDVRDAYARATGEPTEADLLAAVADIRLMAEAAADVPDERIAQFARSLQALDAFEAKADAYIQAVGELLAKQRQDRDDLEAFMVIAALA